MPDHDRSDVKFCRDCARTKCSYFTNQRSLLQREPLAGSTCFKPKEKETQKRACRDCATTECDYSGYAHKNIAEQLYPVGNNCFTPKEETIERACKECAITICESQNSDAIGKFACFKETKEHTAVASVQNDMLRIECRVLTLETAKNAAQAICKMYREALEDLSQGPANGLWAQARAAAALKEAKK